MEEQKSNEEGMASETVHLQKINVSIDCYGGRLRQFYSNWENITNDINVLMWVKG